ncbi:hypothetical protein B9Z55_000192 [Caenorhabditis nigoni]|uniref:F-box associated domain-containing protein n=1 Tax=Caenorhabditis nigoni TaxID=1611254 RepID=A0A2G5VHW3_9PELO|nr:hypothetical protein B9Z55_000192 [Caenorhabditis nigoni]
MESQRMSFCDSKTVLSYMEPNFRFNLALKIPFIRKAEKAAPLHINRLELEDDCVVVNETEYSMRVYRQCQAKTKSFGGNGEVQTKNKSLGAGREVIGLSRGEVNYDFDEYGFKISPEESIQPGDIKLNESARAFQRRGCKLDELEYECPEKSSLPCNHFIRLYVSGCKYQFSYTNMKMYFLMKRLLTIFFGNRNGEWTVKNMNIGNSVLLRWPVNGWKPIVQNFNIGEYSQIKLNGVESIIGANVSLPTLKTSFPFFGFSISDHTVLRNAEHLIFSGFAQDTHLPTLFSIRTHKVSLTFPTQGFFVEALIDMWMEKTRPIGVRYLILADSKANLARISRPEVLQRSSACIKLKMGDEAIVVVRYTEADSKTWLTIETVPKKK